MRNRADIRAVTGKIFTETKLAGGDINEVIHLRAEKGDFVLKTNNDPPPGLFASEAAGLASLRERALRVPEVYLAGEDFLLMQFFSPGSAQPYEAGEMLARLHVEPQLNYGFEAPTYLAALLQENKPQASWSEFYVRYRIEPLLHELGVAEKEEDVQWASFFRTIAPLLDSCPHASLLHGDLWAGNLYYADVGPVFIDPAIYRGDALIDIAMTRLFGHWPASAGGFGPQFYDAYFASAPPRSEVSELIRIYQIYPLLVHARLFGQGYYQSAARIRDRFI